MDQQHGLENNVTYDPLKPHREPQPFRCHNLKTVGPLEVLALPSAVYVWQVLGMYSIRRIEIRPPADEKNAVLLENGLPFPNPELAQTNKIKS